MQCRQFAALATVLLCGCGPEEAIQFAPLTSKQCTLDTPPDHIFSRADLFDEADYWDCARPSREDDGSTDLSVVGTRATVTGSTVRLELAWEGPDSLEGKRVLFWFEPAQRPSVSGTRPRGFHLWDPPNEQNPIRLDLRVDKDGNGGDYRFNFAIDDSDGDPTDPRIGPLVTHLLHVVKVGSGDVQINLNWERLVDLDLWVTDPNGEVINYFRRRVPSGGQLDLDSYPNCRFAGDRGRGNENVFWPRNRAPSGEYIIEVDVYSDCGAFADGHAIDFRVTRILDGEDVDVLEDSFRPGDHDTERREIGRFVY